MAEVKKHTIVYIEDDQGMIDLMKFILSRGNFEFFGVTEGQKGLNLIREIKPDLLLLDLMLPDIGGWAIYQQMKTDPELCDIPVIVVTAQGAPIDRILGEHIAKVQVYITKPFSPKELLKSVNKVLGLEA
ncbi:MAG: response regulator [Anaerolineae bacterium]|nr:response regulator [Anaerolineae bacterium]